MSILEKAIQEINARIGEQPSDIIFDGKIHRFGKKDHAWYSAHEWDFNGKPYQTVNFGSWKMGENHTVKSWGVDEESNKNFRKKFQEHTRDAKIRMEQEQQERQEKCRLKWKPIFDGMKSDTEHEYLKFKGIDQLYTSKAKDGVLFVPAYNANRGFVGVQRIYRSGDSFEKLFSAGIEIRGAFCPLKPFRNSEYGYLAEGFATAASIQKAFPEIPVICVFNAGNIGPAIENIRHINPKIKIMIAADSDQPDKVRGIKAGEHYARIAANRYPSVLYRVVRFATNNPTWTDFNDLHQFEGLEKVQEQLLIDPVEYTEIIPLGYLESDYFYTSSDNSQIIKISASGHANVMNLLQLAGMEYWKKNYGIQDEDGNITIVPWKDVAAELMEECRQIGFFNPEKIRGRGVWFDSGEAIFNNGDSIFPRKEKTSYHYQRTLQIPFYDSNDPISDEDFYKLLSAIANVKFKNPRDHIYVAAWFIQAQIFGSLDWRFHVWISGPKGTGKSKVLEYISSLLAHSIYTDDATAAGLRQKAKNDSVPICYDETEPGKKIVDVLEMARGMNPRNETSSFRGTVNGNVITYNCKMIFLFASIQTELLNSADASRIFKVEMTPENNKQRADWTSEVEPMLIEYQKVKSNIFARCFRSIPSIRQSVVTMKTFMNNNYDLEPRLVDQLAALIACYWVWISMEPITEEQGRKIIEYHSLIQSDYVEENLDKKDSEECFHELMTTEVDRDAKTIAFCIRTIHEQDLSKDDYLVRTLATHGLRYFKEEKTLFISKKSEKLRDKMKKFPAYCDILRRDHLICENPRARQRITDFGNTWGIIIKIPDSITRGE